MMQDVYRKQAYPQDVLKAIRSSGRLGIELANRWMLGWPEAVLALLASGEYLTAFERELGLEKDALAESTATHLAPMEIVALAGLAMGPPSVS